MTRILIVLSLVLAACTSTSTSTTVTVASTLTPTSTPATAAVSAPDDIRPGELDIRSVTMSDGTVIDYGLILPESFDPTVEYPVLLALPSGGQGIGIAVSVAETTYLPQALERGWVVITPAAPEGLLFYQGSEQYIDEILGSVSWIRPEGGRYHLSGISNGGRSAFAVASLDPGRYASMVVFPGYPEAPDDEAALSELAAIPISMFVGGDDPGWITPMTKTRDTLESLGAPVSLEIREGEGHIMGSLADGVDVFTFLDSTR